MTVRLVVLLAAAVAGGCATPATSPVAAAPAPCRAEAAQALVGQAATAANVELARQRAGAEVVRLLQPGQAVTMEYRDGRLNVVAGPDGRIARISCG